MYKPQMDARRVDELSTLVTGLRFFQQLPAHLVSRFLHAMTLHRLRGESLVFKQGDLGDSFAVIMKGSIAVYAKRRPTAKTEITETPNLEGENSQAGTPRSSATAAAPSGPPKRRQFAGAAAGSISIPSNASVNPQTGSISVPGLLHSPLTGASLVKEEKQPDKTFSLVINPKSAPKTPHEMGETERKGVSLVGEWVTPPTSEDESSSNEDDVEDDDDEARDKVMSDKRKRMTDTRTAQERAADALKAIELAKLEAKRAQEEADRLKAEAELQEMLKEEQDLLRLEAQEAHAELECLTTLHARDSFGLLTILEGAKRAATLIALDDTELAVMSRSTYEALMKELNQDPRHPGKPRCIIPSMSKYLRILRQPSEHREDSELNYLYQPLVAQNRMLQMLDSRSLQLIASGMKCLNVYKSGVVLQKQGEDAEWVYVVVKGSISEHVLKKIPADDENLAATKKRSTLSSNIVSPSSQPSASTVPDVLTAYGPCTRLLLTGDMTSFPSKDLQAPTFWDQSQATWLTREPCILAKISVDYLSHVLSGCARVMKHVSPIREALVTPAEKRTDQQLNVLDAILKGVTLFTFKPPALRKTLCARTTLVSYPRAQSVIFQQGESSETFYVILSGSVSIHQKTGKDGIPQAVSSAWQSAPGAHNGIPGSPYVVPEHGVDVLRTFGHCLSIGRAGSHIGDQALISTLPRNMSILTRGPVELMCITRKDYLNVFIPVLDEMQYHASKALQLLSKPQRTPAIVNQLTEVLKACAIFC